MSHFLANGPFAELSYVPGEWDKATATSWARATGPLDWRDRAVWIQLSQLPGVQPKRDLKARVK